jgi:primosomal protein N' (replication factor Y)
MSLDSGDLWSSVGLPTKPSEAQAITPEWVEVLVDCPGAQGLFTYRLEGLQVQPGDILSVPFGPQQIGAIAIRTTPHLPPDLVLSQVRAVDAVIQVGFFPVAYWQLLQQVATYYHTSLVQVIRVALPRGLLARSQRRRSSRTIHRGSNLAIPVASQ